LKRVATIQSGPFCLTQNTAPISPHPPNPLRSGPIIPRKLWPSVGSKLAAAKLKAKWAKPLLTSPPQRYRYSLLATIAPDQVRSARPDCSQSDCEHREDYKDCTSIAHGRTRSAQCTSATPNNTDAIPIHCAIIFASYPAVK